MKTPRQKSSHLKLSPGKTLKLDHLQSRKLSLVCNEGTAWITSPGDQKDYIMIAGQVLNLEVKSRRAGILIESVSGPVSLDVFSA